MGGGKKERKKEEREKKRKKRKKKAKPALKGSPQKRGVCVKVYQKAPKKPNSAQRWVTSMRRVTGVKYKVVRGVLDLGGVEKRRTSRSKYGKKKEKKEEKGQEEEQKKKEKEK